MDKQRRRELMEEYKNRRPEMGVISFHCAATGELFLGASNDTKADFNSNCFQLDTKGHSNKRLQELWSQYGRDGFTLSVARVLKYEDPKADHREELDKLLEQCLESSEGAKLIRKGKTRQ